MDGSATRVAWIRLLQHAHAGELAAALAYRGHWISCRDASERKAIRRIEREEWQHRRRVGVMLRALGAKPLRFREVRASIVGHALSILCRVAGWFLPMYAAGKLESRNVGEYVCAAGYAMAQGRADFARDLLTMAEVEWDHEAYFRARVEAHAGLRFFPMWPSIGPRELIRDEADQALLRRGSRSPLSRASCRMSPRT